MESAFFLRRGGEMKQESKVSSVKIIARSIVVNEGTDTLTFLILSNMRLNMVLNVVLNLVLNSSSCGNLLFAALCMKGNPLKNLLNAACFRVRHARKIFFVNRPTTYWRVNFWFCKTKEKVRICNFAGFTITVFFAWNCLSHCK